MKKRQGSVVDGAKAKSKRPCTIYDECSFDFSADTQEGDAAYEYFLAQGFVVLRKAVTDEHADEAHEEFFQELSKASGGKFKFSDKTTWTNQNMPFDHRGLNIFSRGFVSMMHSRSQWKIRMDPHLRGFFAKVLGSEDIWPSIDRVGFMRPGRSHRTDEYFWHWDQNPLKDPDFCRVQGVVAWKDCPEEVGGFQVVPGSHKDFRYVAPAFTTSRTSDLVNLPRSDEGKRVWGRGVKVPLRKGDIVVWDSRTAHGNFPNSCDTGGDYRLVAYVTFGRPPPPGPERNALVDLRRESFICGSMMKSNRAAFFSGMSAGRYAKRTPERNTLPVDYKPPWDVFPDDDSMEKAGLLIKDS